MHLTLHLTTACNMRCSYCYAPPAPGPVMSEQTALRALELAAANSQRSCGIVFFGGEPLLHADLIYRVVAHAREMQQRGSPPFHFKVTTNGLSLDDTFLDFAVANDVMIAMSMDGTQAAHDLHRRLPNGSPSYDRVREGFDRLLRRKPYATALMVVNPDTVQWLAQSVEELVHAACRYVVISLNHAATWDDRALGVLEEQYEALGSRYVEWTREGRKFYLSPFEVKLASHIDGARFCRDRCELGQRQLSVAPDGTLFPCVQFTRAGRDSPWKVGHVETGVDPSLLAQIRSVSREEKEPCGGCALRNRCNHTCGCLNWQATGSVNDVPPVLCASEKMLVRIADRIGAQLYGERDRRFLLKHYNPSWPLLSLLEDQAGQV